MTAVRPLEIWAPGGQTKEQLDRLTIKAAFFELHGYHPHEYQWKLIHARSERYLMECWPRQHGKSMGLAWEILFRAAEAPRRRIWIVAPNYDLLTPIFDELERASLECLKFAEFSVVKLSKRDWYIEFSNGSRVDGKSAENETTLQGRTLHLMVVEEAASIADERVYHQYLRPMIAVHQAPAIFISTPKGFNWFFDLAQKGMDPLQSEYFFGRAPLGCSPYISREEIDEARRTTPQRVFQQEWEAEFVSDAGAVFRGVTDCVIRGLESNLEPEDGHFYAAGVDLAKHEDYSVITVVDRVTKRQVYWERFNEVDWRRQIPRFAEVCYKFNAPCLMDSTGMGEPIYEFMASMWPQTDPMVLGNTSKEEIVNGLALAVERRDIGLMDIPVQTNELVGYEYHRTKTGKLSMSAPGKHHDDCVIALALAWRQATQGVGQVQTVSKGWRL